MDFGDEDNNENYEQLQQIIDEADDIVLNLLPPKSKAKYMAIYEKFVQWRREKNIAPHDMREEVMLVYLNKLFNEDKLKPPTVWSRYSMLKSTLLGCENINMKQWDKVSSFMKKQARGYCPKKASIFTAEDITKFCSQAPDKTHLVEKVVLILGMAGGLRREEIYNIRTDDIATDNQKNLLISIPKTKNGQPKSFVVEGELREIVAKYQALRPANMPNNKFFINYQQGKCSVQVIGINKIGSMPKKIAAYLGKLDPSSYTGHSFRRTSATLLVDAGADITELKRHGGWKSNAVAEGYLGDSVGNKKRTYSKITKSIETEGPKTKLQSTEAVQSQAQSSIQSAPSSSTSQNKENIPNSVKTGTTCVYHLSNCTVNIVHNNK